MFVFPGEFVKKFPVTPLSKTTRCSGLLGSLVSVSVLMPIIHCFNYWHCFDYTALEYFFLILVCEFSNFILFQLCLAISTWYFTMKFSLYSFVLFIEIICSSKQNLISLVFLLLEPYSLE